MKKLTKLFKWIDNYLLTILLVFFIFFIPLYPKFPFKFIEYTYIAVRLEDFYIVLLVLVFLLQLLRRKVTLNKNLLLPIGVYWLIVFISLFEGAHVLKTVPVFNLGFLHAARRVEYMIVFFIAAGTIQSAKIFKILLYSLLFSFILVNLYGLGQRFLGFPAVSTMNPEFARGHILYLTPEARISSTFGGHYDLASYLVFLIPIVLGFSFSFKNNGRLSLLIFIAVLLSVIVLILTVSRISFIAYIFSIFFLLIITRKWKHLLFLLFFTALLASLNLDLFHRFKKTVQIKQILVNEKTGEVFVPQKITTKELPAGTLYTPLKQIPKIPAPIKKQPRPPLIIASSAATTAFKKEVAEEKVRQEAAKTQRQFTPEEEKRLVASISALLKPISGVVYDISFATRVQVEWPRAVFALLQHPLFGAGPSSITEATDNDYLRWLGEFGFMGFGLFMTILVYIFVFMIQKLFRAEKPQTFLLHGFIWGLIALLINATYFDVFEASKVAYVFWYTTGLYYGMFSLVHEKQES